MLSFHLNRPFDRNVCLKEKGKERPGKVKDVHRSAFVEKILTPGQNMEGVIFYIEIKDLQGWTRLVKGLINKGAKKVCG